MSTHHMKTSFLIAAALVALAMPAAAQTATRSYYNSNGALPDRRRRAGPQAAFTAAAARSRAARPGRASGRTFMTAKAVTAARRSVRRRGVESTRRGA
jgi:hypothetical protein